VVTGIVSLAVSSQMDIPFPWELFQGNTQMTWSWNNTWCPLLFT
jgi:hypothetical protein